MDLLKDVRFAWRGLVRTPGTTLAALAALVIGLGATTAVFTLTRAVLLQGVPYEDADRLISLGGTMQREGAVQDWPVGYLDLEELRAQQVAEGPAAVTGSRSFNLRSGDVARHIQGELVSADYFGILRVGFAQGRGFTVAEASAATPARVAVISHDLWQNDFGGRNDVLGQRVELNEIAYEVIGVAAPRFSGITDDASVWLPIGMAGVIYQPGYTTARAFRWLSGVARLRDGVTAERAQQELSALTRGLGEAYPEENGGFGVSLTPLSEAYFGSWRQPLLIVLAAAAFVLLIACSNVANLLLVRGMDRRAEVALRGALGADRWRIARQFLLESVLLVAIGLAFGLLFGRVALDALVASGGLAFASFIDLSIDPFVIGVGAVSAVICVLLFGTLPAVLSARVNPQAVLRESSNTLTASRSRRGFHNTMLATQIALALMLLVGAALMTRGFGAYVRTDLGFESERIATGRLDLTGEQFRDNERFWATVRAVVEEVAALPDVESVTAEGPGLPTGAEYAIHFERADVPDGTQVMALRHHVTPGYFATLDIPIIAGRDFESGERGPTRELPIIVSASFASLHYGGDAIGKVLRVPNNDTLSARIVGVVADASLGGYPAGEATAPDLYLPLYHAPPRIPPVVTIIARARTGVDLGTQLEEAAKRAAPGLPMFDVNPLAERLRSQTATPRLMTRLVGLFSLIALVLAAIGIYGVITYTVRMRSREIGIRMALGASRRDILMSAMQRIVVPLGVGIVVGIGGAILLGRFAGSLLFGLSTADPAALVLTALGTCVIAVVATLLPARRALRADPREVLR